MARTELSSFLTGANGRVGDFVYYTVWKKDYMRRYVIPHNPNSEAQQSNRLLFAEAMASWKLLSEEVKQGYRKKVRRLPMHGHNLFVKEYIKAAKCQSKSEAGSSAVKEALSGTNNPGYHRELRTLSEASPYGIRISFDTPSIYGASSFYIPPV